MSYEDILKQIAIKENVSIEEVESEMKMAIKFAGLNCSVKDFIETTASLIKEETIYSM